MAEMPRPRAISRDPPPTCRPIYSEAGLQLAAFSKKNRLKRGILCTNRRLARVSGREKPADLWWIYDFNAAKGLRGLRA